MIRNLMLAGIFACVSTAAFASPPSDIADLVGARGAGAESEMQARGYEDVRNNDWWNGETGTCVHVRVSDGRYARIDRLSPSECGRGRPQASSYSADVPRAALRACMRRADEYQNARRGTSIPDEAHRAGPNWVLTMATGSYTSQCTVTGSGRILSIDPA